MIKNNSTVSVHYTGRFTDGQIFDSSDGKDPLTFMIGAGKIIPGFENAIIGKQIGDIVTTNINPSEAYGEVREDLLIKVPKNQLPGEVHVGQSLQAQSETSSINVIVREVNDDHVIIDGNHPLAGQTLCFEIKIIDVR